MTMILAVVLPMLAGALLPLVKPKNRTLKLACITAVLALEAVLCLFLILAPQKDITIWHMTDSLSVRLCSDMLSKLFMALFSFGWLLVAIFSYVYMKHEHDEDRFYAFYLLSEGALIGMSLAANLVTMYVCFELVTLFSMPLVLHSMTREAISAALKYLFYSIAGAFMALLGIFFLSYYCGGDFVAGGNLDASLLQGKENLLYFVIFLTVVGFGTKAGMYPMHGWLPTAHPVAPAPASAVLSALIAKAGVLAIVRVLFYSVGGGFIRGTWVQTTLLCLSLLTVFMGSMMAFREKVFKKRLAYSTVSQISYILTALFLLTEGGFQGAMLHVVFHAVVKTCLFLTAGAFIFYTGNTRVDEFKGLGKQMPVILWTYTLASITLIGIPPTGGFVSKWYIASAALDSGLGVFSYLVPIVLLISALLTAGYLMPISIDAFFPSKDAAVKAERRESALMWVPMVILAGIAVFLGMFCNSLCGFAGTLAQLVL